MIRFLLPITLMALLFPILATSQVRVAVLAFRNMDGKIALNAMAVQLADSLRTTLEAADPRKEHFSIIPQDSVEMAVSELNLDPTNPQYESDVWKALQAMGIEKVVQGNFLTEGERVLMNAYVYDLSSRMPDAAQAKNIYKPRDAVLSAIPVIAKRLLPALIPQQ
jgi:TolB-like protein